MKSPCFRLHYFILTLLIGVEPTHAQGISPFEINPLQTANYEQCISYYKELDRKYDAIEMKAAGASDVHFPIYTVKIDYKKKNNPSKEKLVLLINNGIHPGEADGVDACMMLARDLFKNNEWKKLLEDITLVIIPIYNVGGSLYRNSHSRMNQQGPEEYGFRGNALNLDLNRDFIKCDAPNSISFSKIFSSLKPHLFIDTHTTDGADYPYTMTLVANEKNTLMPSYQELYYQKFLPTLYDKMKQAGQEMSVYVNADELIDKGIYSFMDYPRYSSGYAKLFGTFSCMSESHMLKTHEQRVWAQYYFLLEFIKTAVVFKNEILQEKKKFQQEVQDQKIISLDWNMDLTNRDSLWFSGYEAVKRQSRIGDYQTLHYDTSRPFKKYIPYFNHYETALSVSIPKAYIIPQAYSRVIELLKCNGIEMQKLKRDTLIEVGQYEITDYKTSNQIYENHYKHYRVEVKKNICRMKYYTGDVIVPLTQDGILFLLHTLEPQAPDSYFAYNFFDGILNQKEYFSDYIFEKTAESWIATNSTLKQKLDHAIQEDSTLTKSQQRLLDFIYRHGSPPEPYFMKYPVTRIE